MGGDARRPVTRLCLAGGLRANVAANLDKNHGFAKLPLVEAKLSAERQDADYLWAATTEACERVRPGD